MSEKEVAAGRIPLHAIKVRLNQEQLHTVRVAAAIDSITEFDWGAEEIPPYRYCWPPVTCRSSSWAAGR